MPPNYGNTPQADGLPNLGGLINVFAQYQIKDLNKSLTEQFQAVEKMDMVITALEEENDKLQKENIKLKSKFRRCRRRRPSQEKRGGADYGTK